MVPDQSKSCLGLEYFCTIGDEIWSRMGAEADGLLCVNRNGIALAHAGFSGTLRDLARFGMLFRRGREGPISDRLLRRITGG